MHHRVTARQLELARAREGTLETTRETIIKKTMLLRSEREVELLIAREIKKARASEKTREEKACSGKRKRLVLSH